MKGCQRRVTVPRRRAAGILATALAAALAAGCAASQPKPRQAPPPGVEFETSQKTRSTAFANADVLSRFQAPPETTYRIGPGDELTIEVWGRGELSGKHVVGPDGRITVPVAGSLQVADLSADQAGRAVTKSLARFYVDAVATVRIDHYVSNRVFVLGRVSHPGAIEFDTTPTLLETITRAGALPIGGIGAEKAALTRCAIFRGRDQVIWINLKTLLKSGNLSYNINLQRNDLVYLPDADDRLVYVLGEVHKPGAYQLSPDMSFLDALSLAGGPTPDAAQGKLHLVRTGEHLEQDIDFGEFLAGSPDLNFALEEGDILWVPPNGLAKVGYVLQKLSPVTTLFIFARP
jgi:polysaccharide export outer membrane protein